MFLLFIACIAGDPLSCRPYRIPVEHYEAPPMACLTSSQSLLAEWHEAHPNRVVSRFRCVSKRRLQVEEKSI